LRDGGEVLDKAKEATDDVLEKAQEVVERGGEADESIDFGWILDRYQGPGPNPHDE
jgi:hypothetical protein